MHFKSKVFSAVLCTILVFEATIIPVIKCHSVRRSSIRAAPYFMPFENNPQPIEEIIQESGIKHLILAFVLATNHGECRPVWDGKTSQSVENDKHVLDIVERIRAAGGDVAISFGGYNGIELGHACKTAEELAAAYQQVIDKYDLTNIDFDIEGEALGRVDEEYRRFEAINILRQNAAAKGRKLFVTLTMPVTIVGLSEVGRAEIQRAIETKCDIDLYKIMAFDYGGTSEYQAESIREVMEQVHEQLKSIRRDLSDAQVYAATGLILMNGHTDQATELYTQSVFREMVKYAETKGMGRISFWALNRDRQCDKEVGWAAGFCSSVRQSPYEFSKIISNFDNYKPPKPITDAPITEAPTKPMPKPTPIETMFPTKATPTTPSNDNHHHHPDTPPTSNPIHDHEFDCKIEINTFHPYDDDCHLYIHCYEGKVHIEMCPPGTIFDNTLHLCNFEQSVQRPECKR